MIEILINTAGIDINKQGYWGYTPLHGAVLSKELESVRLLLGHNADPNIQDKAGNTPLHLVIQGKYSVGQRKKMIEILINTAGIDINKQDNRGYTPLHGAVLNEELESVRLLLGHNADPNIKDQDGNTPLNSAIKTNNYKIIELLRSYGAN